APPAPEQPTVAAPTAAAAASDAPAPAAAPSAVPASPATASAATPPKETSGANESALFAAARIWLAAYKVEVILFAVSFVVLASFSSQRFLRQSEAPHF